MRKLLSILLMIVIVISLVGCSSKESTDTKANDINKQINEQGEINGKNTEEITDEEKENRLRVFANEYMENLKNGLENYDASNPEKKRDVFSYVSANIPTEGTSYKNWELHFDEISKERGRFTITFEYYGENNGDTYHKVTKLYVEAHWIQEKMVWEVNALALDEGKDI